MKFQEKLIKGKFIKRYKRFFADVELSDGTLVTAHCPNTGSMKGILEAKIAYISRADNPTRKLKYTLQVMQKGKVKIGVNTHLTNHIAEEAIRSFRIPELSNFKEIRREVKYGSQNSRIDILLVEEDDSLHYVEVKNTTLSENNVGMFPDAVTTRGQKHLKELMQMVREGHKATMFYVVNRDDCDKFRPCAEIDPEYAKLLKEAAKVGVQVIAYACKFGTDEIKISNKVEVILD